MRHRRHHEFKARFAARAERMRDRMEARSERWAARREARGGCSAYAGGPWAYWWVIFPLVFWVLPSLARQDRHGWSGDGVFAAAGGGAWSALRGWFDNGAAGWVVDGFASLTGLSQGAAGALLLLAVIVNGAAIAFALTRPLSRRRLSR